jgi:hypothetical protein
VSGPLGSARGVGVTMVLALLALTSAGCASNGSGSAPSAGVMSRPSSTGRITIVSPVNGQVIHGTDVSVRVHLSGATIVPATTASITPDQGHLHLSLDGEIVSMNFRPTAELHNVSAGIHVIQVEFVASDHLPFDPRVIEQVTFEVRR